MMPFTDSHENSRYQKLRALVLLCALLAACQTAPPVVRESAVIGEGSSAAALPEQAETFEVLPQQSEIRLLVYRAGALAGFGHNHVITGAVEGRLFRDATSGSSAFRLHIPVNGFDIDPPAARAEEGEDFPGTLSDKARKATRENMLGKMQLNAEAFPEIRIESVSLSGPRWNPDVTARLSIRGKAKTLRFPAAVFEHDGRMEIIANFTVKHSDFGITPYSAFGGGLKVRDAIDIRVRVTAAHRP